MRNSQDFWENKPNGNQTTNQIFCFKQCDAHFSRRTIFLKQYAYLGRNNVLPLHGMMAACGNQISRQLAQICDSIKGHHSSATVYVPCHG